MCLTGMAAECAACGWGQATETATRDYSFAVFGLGGNVHEGRGASTSGGIVGFTMARHLHLFDPSFEVRVGLAPGPVVSEHTVLVGFKVEKKIWRFHPYGDFLVGHGTINYKKAGFSDDSIIPSYGGGVDFELGDHWGLKADYSRQSWRLGTDTPRFGSSTLSIGIQYRFHF